MRQDGGSDVGEAGGVGEAVQQAESEEQESGGHAAEEEVFECGFPGLQAALAEGGEDVEGEAEQLERDEDDEQILRADQEHHAGGCHEDQQDELADVLGEGGVCGEQEGADGEDEERDLDQVGEWAGNESAVEDVCLRGGQQNAEDGAGTADRRQAGGYGEAGAGRLPANDEEVDGHDDESRNDDDDLGDGELQELRVVNRVHCQLPLRRPSKSGELSAGTMMLRSNCG